MWSLMATTRSRRSSTSTAYRRSDCSLHHAWALPEKAVSLSALRQCETFGSASFYAFNTAKIRAARDLMAQTGRPVVFTDLDTAWLKSPLEQLARLPSSKAFAIGPEGSHLDFARRRPSAAAPCAASDKQALCMCVLLCGVPELFGRNYAGQVVDGLPMRTGMPNEQLAFQWLLNLWPELIKGRTRNAGAASPPTRLSAASAAATLPAPRVPSPRGFSGDDGWLNELLANSSGFGAEGDDCGYTAALCLPLRGGMIRRSLRIRCRCMRTGSSGRRARRRRWRSAIGSRSMGCGAIAARGEVNRTT